MRYKEYNVNKVSEQCINLFWEKGFRGVSVNDIVQETGVNRFSLYHEFENKEGVLYGALKLYRERYCEDKLAILKKDGAVKDILTDFYLSFLNNDDDNQGCFIIHVGTEIADTDPHIKTLLKNYLDEIEQLFVKLLMRNDDTKENAAFYAKHLIGLFCTSMSFCLIHTEPQRLAHISNGINVILNKNTTPHATSPQ